MKGNHFVVAASMFVSFAVSPAAVAGFWDSITQSLTDAATDQAKREADRMMNDTINGLPSTGSGPRVIRAGDPTVREIQQRLSELGYSPGPSDGIMGDRTRMAIYSYQQSMGLPADGRASGQLLSTLRSQVALPTASPVPQPQTHVPVQPGQQPFWPAVQQGHTSVPAAPATQPSPEDQRPLTRNEVAAVQRYLDEMGFAPGRIDGNVDARTESGIYAFQREFGLEADGMPSVAVLKSLREHAVTSSTEVAAETLKPIEVAMDAGLRRAEKTLWYECEREKNEERVKEGLAEIKLLTPEEVQARAKAEQMAMVAQVGRDMIGAYYEETNESMLAKAMQRAGQAPTMASMEADISAQHGALVEIKLCVKLKQQANASN